MVVVLCVQVGGNFVAVGNLLARLVLPSRVDEAASLLGGAAAAAGGSGALHHAAGVASAGEL